MSDDRKMDDLLTSAMAAARPQPSAEFRRSVMRRVSPRRPPAWTRAVLGGYGLASLALSAWLLQGLPPIVVVAGVGTGALAAAAAGWYASSVARLDEPRLRR